MSKNLAQIAAHFFPIVILTWLAGCAGGNNDSASGGAAAAPTTPGAGGANYTIGGTVSGLSGTVGLQDNGGNDLSLSANSGFTFTTAMATGSNYSVTVLTQPAGQTCAIANGAGTVSGANVTDVTVSCASSFASASLALFAGKMEGRGSVDGAAAAARFNTPHSAATDGAGNVYVADSNNNTIRKITRAGVVTTLAGTAGVFGSTDATGAAASFNSPHGVATDGAGNVYVADTFNSIVRKITPAGAVTTLVGTAGVTGSTDATGAAARFFFPQGVATDGAGNVYVADTSNQTLRKITPAGAVTTLAGTAGSFGADDATGAAARFNYPQGVATDGAGNIYVADTTNDIIRKITSAGVVTTLAGTVHAFGSTDATGTAARFNFPQGIATDGAGNVYVADSGNSVIRKVTPTGVVTTLAGSAGVSGSTDASGTAARFNTPQGVATDSAGNVYVADANNNTIREITSAGVVTTLAGSASIPGSTDATGAAASFSLPVGVATDGAGNVYVADANNHTIRKITPAGAVATLAGTAGVTGRTDATGAAASFNFPRGVATDGAGNVYVADSGNSIIRKITPAGVVTTLAGSGVFGSTDATGAAATFGSPFGLAADSAGNVYVADSGNNIIRKITPAGVVTTLAGIAFIPGNIDGPGGAATFNFPFSVAADSAGNVYVAGTLNNTIRKITPAGVVTTLAGTANVPGSTDASGAATSFNGPTGVATDSAGNVYVADNGNSTIRKITPAGVVSTVAGVVGQAGFVPGPLPGRLGLPFGVAVSGTSLYITLYNGVAVVQNLP